MRLLKETDSKTKAKRLFTNPSAMKHIKTFAICTSENPPNSELTNSENTSRSNTLKRQLSYNKSEYDNLKLSRNQTYDNKLLLDYSNIEDELKINHFPYYKTKGKYGSTEHSYLVYNISLHDCKKLCKAADQDSFIFGTNDSNDLNFEFWSSNGADYIKLDTCSMIKGRVNSEDNYTQISKDFKFTIPFSIFNEQLEKVSIKIDKKIELYEDYKYDKWLEKLLDNKVNGKEAFRLRRLIYVDIFYPI